MRKCHSESFLLNKIFKLKFEVGHFKTRTSFIGCSLLIRFSPTKIPIVRWSKYIILISQEFKLAQVSDSLIAKLFSWASVESKY